MQAGQAFYSGSVDKPCVVIVVTVSDIEVRFITIGWLLMGAGLEPMRLDISKDNSICRIPKDIFEATHFSNLNTLISKR
ncbi:MAG: hypothetical protein WC942_07595 [Clostridia bacterium]|jgi:hypothetical protein